MTPEQRDEAMNEYEMLNSQIGMGYGSELHDDPAWEDVIKQRLKQLENKRTALLLKFPEFQHRTWERTGAK